jgi:hypothetical protein
VPEAVLIKKLEHMRNDPKNQIETIEHLAYIIENGRFLGIRGTERFVVNLYRIDDRFAELYYDRQTGFIKNIKYSAGINTPGEYTVVPN